MQKHLQNHLEHKDYLQRKIIQIKTVSEKTIMNTEETIPDLYKSTLRNSTGKLHKKSSWFLYREILITSEK